MNTKIMWLAALLTIGCTLPVEAQKRPGWIAKARRAVLTVETYDRKGNLRKGNGFFVGADGEAVSDYALFANAERATVIDADGNRWPVSRIVGASELYDVVRFTVAVQGRPASLVPTAAPVANGAAAYLLSAGKEPTSGQGRISEISPISGNYGYYRIDMPMAASDAGLPLLTEKGEVFAIAQADASGRQRTYGVSIAYIRSLRISSTDLFNSTYTSIGLPKAWPAKADDAQVMLLLLASQQDAATYLTTLDDFVATFPDMADGYLHRASHCATRRNELADTDAARHDLLRRALNDLDAYGKRQTDDRAGALYSRAQLIGSVAVADTTLNADGWTVAAARELLQQAIAIEERPHFRLLDGELDYHSSNYARAYESAMAVNRTEAASGESYWLAARAQMQLPEPNRLLAIALLDSAVNKSSDRPEAALIYLQAGIDLKTQLNQFDAVAKDYDRYHTLSGGRVTDAFHYLRGQARFRANDLDGALKDFNSAIVIDPDNAAYYAEEASVYLRKKELATAVERLEKALALDPEFAAGHRLMGVCLIRQQKKREACRSFARAKELGDPVAERLIGQHCN